MAKSTIYSCDLCKAKKEEKHFDHYERVWGEYNSFGIKIDMLCSSCVGSISNAAWQAARDRHQELLREYKPEAKSGGEDQ